MWGGGGVQLHAQCVKQPRHYKKNERHQVWSHIFRGGSSSAPTGVDTQGGGVNGGWGVGWTVDLTLRKTEKNGVQRGTCNPPHPPLDPPLILGRTPITFSNSLCIRSRSSLVMWTCQWWQVAVCAEAGRGGRKHCTWNVHVIITTFGSFRNYTIS